MRATGGRSRGRIAASEQHAQKCEIRYRLQYISCRSTRYSKHRLRILSLPLAGLALCLSVYIIDLGGNDGGRSHRRYLEHPPASTLVEVRKLALPELLIEIEAVAHLRE